jgi:hypothetical protein
VRRHAILITLVLSEIGIAALALFFHLRSRPVVLKAFSDFNTALPPTTALALAPWFLPSALAVAALCTACSLALPLRRKQRPLVAGAGLIVLAFALIFAVWATFLPLFQPG